MAYSKKKLAETALNAIEENSLVFIEEVVSFLPCSKKTFYNYSLHELPSIKEALEENRVSAKSKLRKRMQNSDSAAAMIAAYKLLGNEDDAARLNGSNTKVELSGKLKVDGFDPTKLTDKELDKLTDLVTKAQPNGS